MLSMPLELLGKKYLDRDHTTIMSSLKKVKEMMEENKMFALEIEELKREIQGV
jgi:chromosomal replication initiation ATPase DnaA